MYISVSATKCAPRRTDTDINMNSYLYIPTRVCTCMCVKTLSPLKPPCDVTPAHTYIRVSNRAYLHTAPKFQ